MYLYIDFSVANYNEGGYVISMYLCLNIKNLNVETLKFVVHVEFGVCVCVFSLYISVILLALEDTHP